MLNADVHLKLQLLFLVQYNGGFTTVRLPLSRSGQMTTSRKFRCNTNFDSTPPLLPSRAPQHPLVFLSILEPLVMANSASLAVPPSVSPSKEHLTTLASLPFPPLLPSLPALLASLHSLLLHNRQVAQFSASCPFFADIACHYVSLCTSLISLPSPSLLFPSATGEST